MKRDILYLQHILDSIKRIEQYTNTGKESFLSSLLIQDAVIRNLEVIGEATKNISSEFRQDNSHLPWKQMAAMRDVLIHDYMGIDLTIVWNVVIKELPYIKEQLSRLVKGS